MLACRQQHFSLPHKISFTKYIAIVDDSKSRHLQTPLCDIFVMRKLSVLLPSSQGSFSVQGHFLYIYILYNRYFLGRSLRCYRCYFCLFRSQKSLILLYTLLKSIFLKMLWVHKAIFNLSFCKKKEKLTF